MNRAAFLLERAGLAFAFLYPPIDALFEPYSWLGYIPSFARGYVPDLALLHAFGALEVVLALWILSGRRIFWPSLLSGCILLFIVATNLSGFEVVFRDLTIAALAFSLALRSKAKNPA